MEPLIQIRLSNESLCNEENKKTLITFYTGLVNLTKEKELWDRAQTAAHDGANTAPYPSRHRDNSLPTNGTIGRIASPGNAYLLYCRAVGRNHRST
jgi:hypothetical protein